MRLSHRNRIVQDVDVCQDDDLFEVPRVEEWLQLREPPPVTVRQEFLEIVRPGPALGYVQGEGEGAPHCLSHEIARTPADVEYAAARGGVWNAHGQVGTLLRSESLHTPPLEWTLVEADGEALHARYQTPPVSWSMKL